MSEGALQEVSQPAECMLRDRSVPGPDHQAQVHVPALGTVSATATQAVSQVSYWECFWWEREQSHQRGLPPHRQLEPGMEGGV